MKSGKGVTLISLVIYVMSFLVIAGIVAVISNFFFNNSKVLSSGATASIEFDMLNLYLTKETKQYENWVSDVTDKKIKKENEDKSEYYGIEKKIVFSNGNEYIFIKENEDDEYGKIIFSNHEKYFVLCNYIENLELSQSNEEELKITVEILGKEYTQNYIIEK